MERLAEEKVNRLEITGDLIDELSRLPQCRQVLADGAALFPDGIDFCYGNHEYYRGLADITDMLETTPVRIVRNSHFCASPGRGQNLSGRSGRDGRPFYIAGTDFSFAPSGHLHDEQRREYTQQALDGIPEDAFTILLAHNSAFIDEGFAHRIPLTMCGHTRWRPSLRLSGPLVQARRVQSIFPRPVQKRRLLWLCQSRHRSLAAFPRPVFPGSYGVRITEKTVII